jgi:membrane-associated phospholipid phosphatase
MIKKSTSILLLSTSLLTLSVKAQVQDSAKTVYKPELTAFIPAAAAVTYGFVAINSNLLRKFDNYLFEEAKEHHPGYRTKVDDYMRYAPAAAVYALDLVGIKGKHNFKDKTALFLLSSVLTNGSVLVLKKTSNRMRPNRLNDYSFPSGHTASAFAYAEYLSQEYGDKSIWYTVGGYGAASATAVLRIYRNYHWFSDVVAGAGMGILSTKFAYLVYPSLRKMVLGNKKTDMVVLPVYQNGGPGLVISGKF